MSVAEDGGTGERMEEVDSRKLRVERDEKNLRSRNEAKTRCSFAAHGKRNEITIRPQKGGSEMGRKGVHPLCFLKSGEVAWNELVAEGWKTRVCRWLKRRGLRSRESSQEWCEVRRGGYDSRRRIARIEVHVNNDLSCGNSNERMSGSNLTLEDTSRLSPMVCPP